LILVENPRQTSREAVPYRIQTKSIDLQILIGSG
jgi:hypothetical protein